MSDGFYRALEDRYRGSRELIKNRLKVYIPFILPLLKNNPSAEALDLGCGRGEWLEVLNDVGFKSKGIDLDLGMLDACVKLGLDVKQGDALTYLSLVPDSSLNVVSAFHVVEHISFEQLRLLADEALRVLKPGGLLILETPNPENIVVATRNFYLDPTHERPIPPLLLAFVAEYAGFARVKTLRLQESQDLLNKIDVSLHNVFAGVSPDYAIVAQKYAADDIMGLTNQPFSYNHGLSLDDLLKLWDSRFDRLESKAQQVEFSAEQAEMKAGQAEMKAGQAEMRAEHAEMRAEQAEMKAEQAEMKAEQAELKAVDSEQNKLQLAAHLDAVYASTSWRISAPVRWLGNQSRLLAQHGAKMRIKALFIKVIKKCILFINSQPRLRYRIVRLVRCVGAENILKRIYWRIHSPHLTDNSELRQAPIAPTEAGHRASQIYRDLKHTIEQKKKAD